MKEKESYKNKKKSLNTIEGENSYIINFSNSNNRGCEFVENL